MQAETIRPRTRTLIGIALLAGYVALGCDAGEGVQADAGALAQSVVVDGKLDSEAFRQEIEALEGALYLSRAETEEDYKRVGALALGLANAIGRRAPPTMARNPSGKLLFFSAQAETGHDDPLVRDLTTIQKQWEKLRREYFSPARWHRISRTG